MLSSKSPNITKNKCIVSFSRELSAKRSMSSASYMIRVDLELRIALCYGALSLLFGHQQPRPRLSYELFSGQCTHAL